MSKKDAQKLFDDWYTSDRYKEMSIKYLIDDSKAQENYRAQKDHPERAENEIKQKVDTLKKNLNHILSQNLQYKSLIDNTKKRIMSEAWRTPDNHFRMYCLTQGISEKDMLSLAEENPPEEIIDKIQRKVSGFYDMVLKDDKDKIINFYTKLCTMTEDKVYDFGYSADPDTHSEQSIANTLLYKESKSYFEQTLNLGVKGVIPIASQEIISAVNNNLKAQNKSYNFDQAATILNIIDSDYQSTIIPLKSHSETSKKQGFEKSSIRHARFAQILRQICAADKEDANQLLASLDPDKINYDLGNIQTLSYTLDDLTKNGEYKPTFNVTKCSTDLKNSAHTIAGFRHPSDKYRNIYDDLDRIAKMENRINEEKRNGQIDKELDEIKQAKEEYNKLLKHCNHYLEVTNPGNERQDFRYAMILKTQDIANENLRRLGLFETKEVSYFKAPEKLAKIRTKQTLASIRTGQYAPDKKIGSSKILQNLCTVICEDMENGAGFNIDKLAQLQAATVFVKLGDNVTGQLTWKDFYQMADSFKDQKYVVALSEKYPEGTKIASASKLVSELNDIKTRTSMKNDAKENQAAVNKTIVNSPKKEKELKQPLK